MALSKANDDLMRKRREKVARLRLQGLTEREIALALPTGSDPIVDPDTKKPYSNVTIHADLEYMKTEWQTNAARDASEFISEQLAELDELKKSAWKDKRYDVVMKCMERRAKLLGLDKPTKIDATSNGNELKGLTAEYLSALDKIAEAQLGNWKEVRGGSTSATDDSAK